MWKIKFFVSVLVVGPNLLVDPVIELIYLKENFCRIKSIKYIKLTKLHKNVGKIRSHFICRKTVIK